MKKNGWPRNDKSRHRPKKTQNREWKQSVSMLMCVKQDLSNLLPSIP